MSTIGGMTSQILAQSGERCIYREEADPSRDSVRQCSCVDRRYQQPNPDCPICFGAGWVYDATGISGKDSVQQAYFDVLDSAQFWARIGQLQRGDALVYCNISFIPRTGDYVLRSGSWWGNSLSEYVVLISSPFGNLGVVQYWQLACRPTIYKSKVEK